MSNNELEKQFASAMGALRWLCLNQPPVTIHRYWEAKPNGKNALLVETSDGWYKIVRPSNLAVADLIRTDPIE